MVCTFIGNRNCLQSVKTELEILLMELIEKFGVNMFYVGNHGNFDYIAIELLRKIKKERNDIEYAVVLAYLDNVDEFYTYETIYPEGLETVPKKYAINKRNEWMINQSDYVIAYVKNTSGCSEKIRRYAEKRGKKVLEL